MLGWLVLGSFALPAAEKWFATLRIGDQVLTNALVLRPTRQDVFIQHAGGLMNFKLADLEPEVLAQLGDEVVAPAERVKAPPPPPRPLLQRIMARPPEAPSVTEAPAEPWTARVRLSLPPMSRGLQVLVLGLLLALHLGFSLCAKLIVEKTGQAGGPLIWLPVLQMIPLLRAAGLAGWCALLLLVPLVNVLIGVLWCFRIVAARGKHPFWAILLLLPGTNLLAFLYLALAQGRETGTEVNPLALAEAA